jgi:hypothetical protein
MNVNKKRAVLVEQPLGNLGKSSFRSENDTLLESIEDLLFDIE